MFLKAFKDKEQNKRFFSALLALVIPITIQNFISNAVNSADVLMLGAVGQTELSAVSLANQYQFILGGFFFGISSGVTMLASQYWGKKDTDAIQVVMGIAVKIGLVITGLLTLGALAVPDMLMRIYTQDQELIDIGAGYLRIIGISYMLMSFSQVYMCAQRSMERAKFSTIVSSVALVLNVFLNSVFIFGLLGAPKLGVIGVGVATLIARSVECALCFIDSAKGVRFKTNIKLMFGGNKILFRDFIRYATPALLNDFSWTLAYSAYSAIMGHMSSDVVAANSVASTVRGLCTVVCFAIASGASVLLGIEMGEGRMEDAKHDADRSCWVTFGAGVVTGIIIIIIRPLVFPFFDLTETAALYLNVMLWINSYYVVAMAMNTLVIAGIFRAGGDSKFGLICDSIVMWCVSLPLGLICAFVLKLPPMWVYFILCLDEFWKLPVVYKRYKSRVWLRDITRENIKEPQPEKSKG